MQYVVHLMEHRASVDNVAVTVNARAPLEIIQPHSEGDSTAQLDLFSLHCVRNAVHGGENVLSLIDQSADHSALRAKEKAIVGTDLSSAEIEALRRQHRDARAVVSSCSDSQRTLLEHGRARVVVRPAPVAAARSQITGTDVITYWDNVTVHDRAFHRHHYELLRHLGLLNEGAGGGYEAYMHVERDSPWQPADTDSGDVPQTASLFSLHVVHKMAPDELLLFNNRTWTHAVNNWPPDEVRTLTAMYA